MIVTMSARTTGAITGRVELVATKCGRCGARLRRDNRSGFCRKHRPRGEPPMLYTRDVAPMLAAARGGKTVLVVLSMPEGARAEIDAWCARTQMSRSAFMRRAAERFIDFLSDPRQHP